MNKIYTTKTREETIKLGKKIAKGLKPGDVVALIGELGSGKTTLVKGISKGLGVKDPRYVNSPSFVIIKEYKGKVNLYHFDVFRLNSPDDLDLIGYEEYFYGDGVCLVEWADKINKLLPKKHLEIKISILKGNNRKIVVDDKDQEESLKHKAKSVRLKLKTLSFSFALFALSLTLPFVILMI